MALAARLFASRMHCSLANRCRILIRFYGSPARAAAVTLHLRLAATMAYVAHDRDRAMALGGRVVVMRGRNVERSRCRSAYFEDRRTCVWLYLPDRRS